MKSFKILNNKDNLREKFERLVKEQFGDYDYKFVLYAGRAKNESLIRENLSKIKMFGKPVELVIIRELLADFINSIQGTKNKISTYNNEITIATLQALNEYKMLKSSD